MADFECDYCEDQFSDRAEYLADTAALEDGRRVCLDHLFNGDIQTDQDGENDPDAVYEAQRDAALGVL